MKTILHIDFDSFFASVEQQDNPSLRDKPIGVTAAHSRTAVIACSKEAKRMGVVGGSSYFIARKVCPQLQLVPAHFTRYFEISKQFIQICRLYSPYLEVFSIDELFLDVTQTIPLFGSVENLIARLKRHIARDIGEIITVSVGVSHNKMLAKLGSGLRKPNGVTYIRPENVEAIYREAALTDICGIGRRIEKRLHMLGITNLLQLRSVPFAVLEAEFGPHEAGFLSDVAWAQDDAEVVSFGKSPETKSVGRNYCLPKNEYNKRVVLQNVFELFEEVAIKLRRLQKKTRSVGVYLRGDAHIGGHKTVSFYMNSGKEMFDTICRSGLVRQLEQTTYIRQISVWAGYLQNDNAVPVSLFDQHDKKETLLRVIDSVNDKFGDHTIRNGFLLYSPKLTTVPNGYLADKWDRMQLTKLY